MCWTSFTSPELEGLKRTWNKLVKSCSFSPPNHHSTRSMSDSEERRDSDAQASNSDSDANEFDGGCIEEGDSYKCATPEEIPKFLEQLKADEADKFDEVFPHSNTPHTHVANVELTRLDLGDRSPRKYNSTQGRNRN